MGAPTVAEEFAADLNRFGVKPRCKRPLIALGREWDYVPTEIEQGQVEIDGERIRWTGKERGWVVYMIVDGPGLTEDQLRKLAAAKRARALRELEEAEAVLGPIARTRTPRTRRDK